MADTTAHLVDRVIPPVPGRQFVLTLPWPLRLRMAYDAELTTAVLTVVLRAIQGYYRGLARKRGIAGVAPELIGVPRGIPVRIGALTSFHRAGSALNVNLHFHVLLLDGVYYQLEPNSDPLFQPLVQHSDAGIRSLTHTIRDRVVRLLERNGLLPAPDGNDQDGSQLSLLARLTELSVAGLTPDGNRPARERAPVPTSAARRRPVGRSRSLAPKPKPLCHAVDGFSLHARGAAGGSDAGSGGARCRPGPSQASSVAMSPSPNPMQFLILTLASWLNRRQQREIDYLLEENRVLREQLGKRRLRLTDDQRRRLAVKGKVLGRKVLQGVAGIVTFASRTTRSRAPVAARRRGGMRTRSCAGTDDSSPENTMAAGSADPAVQARPRR